MLYFKLYPFNYSSSLVVSHSYLCNWVNYCSIISQVIIYLKVLKCWISILNLALFCSTLPAQLAQHYCSLWTCLRLTLCWLGPRVALLVVDLFRLSQPFLLCVEHLGSLCSLFSCLWRLSINTLTFVGPVLVSFYLLCQSNFLLLMFHSPELFEYLTIFSSL